MPNFRACAPDPLPTDVGKGAHVLIVTRDNAKAIQRFETPELALSAGTSLLAMGFTVRIGWDTVRVLRKKMGYDPSGPRC